MTPEEAATQITATGEQFVVFRDAETNRTGVVYTRKDGHFGLIDP
jgi:putative sigma-54 modulation protein